MDEIQKTNLKDVIWSDDIAGSFLKVMRNEQAANQYIQSVLLEVAGREDLQECTSMSIVKAALEAASLGLSCARSMKQAWLVPYNVKVKARNVMRDGKPITIPERWEKQAQFQPHYRGLYNLAMRTGLYWIINCSPVYKGQRVMMASPSGLHFVQEENGLLTMPQALNPAYTSLIDVTNLRRREMERVGWIGYFKTKKAEEKTVYWSVDDIEDHARQYVGHYENGKWVSTFDRNPNWNSKDNPDKRTVMEMKTTLRDLLSWTDKSVGQASALARAMSADERDPETVDAITIDEIVKASESEQQESKTPQTNTPYNGSDLPNFAIDPFTQDWITYAANQWGVSRATAKAEMEKQRDKFPKGIMVLDFKRIVNGR